MKLPIKARILEYAIEQKKPFTASEIAEALQTEYPGEKTSSQKKIEKTLNTYCGVGVLRTTDIQFDENQELIVWYEVTDFGKGYEKMIPGHS